jgi:hypothetical protein
VFTAIKIMAIGVTWLISCEGGRGGEIDSGCWELSVNNSQVKAEGETGFVSYLDAFTKLRKAIQAFIMPVSSARIE